MQAKYLTLSNGRKIRMNTPEEDAAINTGIAQDPDTYEVGTAEFKQLRRGRPLGSGTKMQITLRLDVEVVDKFKASGSGWQTRINDALKIWVQTHAWAASLADESLLVKIKQPFESSQSIYVSPRVHGDLRETDHIVLKTEANK